MALTATAVPRIQKDICENLQLRDPKICLRSFDRPNLAISVRPKDLNPGQAYATAMKPLLRQLKKCSLDGTSASSTIIYAPTRREVEGLASYLQEQLRAEKCSPKIQVEPYHAGFSTQHRQLVHTNFLTGITPVIVATVAFGMGIDKTDTREVIHFGPPKTVEEYYQQIGRAGRDGLPSKCILYTDGERDFDRYKSDFYVGGLSGAAKQATLESLEALKTFALDKTKCRRKMLLEFFGEEPKFGEKCGTCDTCICNKTFDTDEVRDFTVEGKMILSVLACLKSPGMTAFTDVLAGNIVQAYRYKDKVSPYKVQKIVEKAKKSFSMPLHKGHLRDLVHALVQTAYIHSSIKTGTVMGSTTSWAVYDLTNKGAKAVKAKKQKIKIPVPDSILEIERQKELQRQEILQELEEKGIKKEALPQNEIEKGDGVVIQAYTKWHHYLEGQKRIPDNGERVEQLEELLSEMREWRSNTAVKSRMAPGDVLAEHTLVAIAYNTATLPPGKSVEKSALVTAGARSNKLDSLVSVLNDWRRKHAAISLEGDESDDENAKPMLTSGLKKVTATKWAHAVYTPLKKTGLAFWESSHTRFMDGEDPQTIAMAPAHGKPIQQHTVIGHVLEGLVHGRQTDLHRLAQYSTPPTKEEWDQLEEAELLQGMNVLSDPTTSGKDGGKFFMTDFLTPIMGEAFSSTPRDQRSASDTQKFSKWCGLLNWYKSMKRAKIEPKFAAF